MASEKRSDIFALCRLFLFGYLIRGVFGQYPYEYVGNITVLNVTTSPYDPLTSYFYVDYEVPNEDLEILNTIGQDASNNLTIKQYMDTGLGKIMVGKETAICSFFENKDDPKVQYDLEARTIFTILFPTQQSCPFKNDTYLMPAGYSTAFNFDTVVSCDSWKYILEIPDPINPDTPRLTVTMRVDMEKMAQCSNESILSQLTTAEPAICDGLSNSGSNLTLNLIYATGKDNDYIKLREVNIVKNIYEVDVLDTLYRPFFRNYFQIFFYSKLTLFDKNPKLMYENSICDLIENPMDNSFPSEVTHMIFQHRNSCTFKNGSSLIATNASLIETPSQNPGVIFPDAPRWYLQANIILQRDIDDPLDSYIISVLYAVDQVGLENSEECIPVENAIESQTTVLPLLETTSSGSQNILPTTESSGSMESITTVSPSSLFTTESPTVQPLLETTSSGPENIFPTTESSGSMESITTVLPSLLFTTESPTTVQPLLETTSSRVANINPTTESSDESISISVVSSEEGSSSESKKNTSQESFIGKAVDDVKEVGHVVKEVVYVPIDIIAFIKRIITTNVGGVIRGLMRAFHKILRGGEFTVDSIENAIKEVFDEVEGAFSKVYNTVKGSVEDVVDVTEDGYDDIVSVIKSIWHLIKGTFHWASFIIRHPIKGTETAAKKIFSAVENKISNVVSDVEIDVRNDITDVENGVESVISKVKNGVVSTVKKGINAVEDGAEDVYSGIKKGAINAVHFIEHPIDGTENIINKIERPFKLEKEEAELKENLTKLEKAYNASVAEEEKKNSVLGEATDTVINTVFHIINLLIATGKETKTLVSNTVSDSGHEIYTIGSRIVHLIKSGVSGIGSITDDIANKIKNTTSGAFGNLNKIVESPISGTVHSISSLFSWIKNTIFGLISGIYHTVKNSIMGVYHAVKNTVDEVSSIANQLISETEGLVGNTTSGIEETISYAVHNITNEAKQEFNEVINKVNYTVTKKVPNEVSGAINKAANDTTHHFIQGCKWYTLGVTNNCIFQYLYDGIVKLPINLVVGGVTKVISLIIDIASLPIKIPLDIAELPITIPEDIVILAAKIPYNIVKYATKYVVEPIASVAKNGLSFGAKEVEDDASIVGNRIFAGIKKAIKMYL